MSTQCRSTRLALLILVASGWLTPGSMLAADAPPEPVSDNLLDRPVVDLAVVPGGDGAPDLLTVSAEVDDAVQVSLLHRDGVWKTADELVLPVADGGADEDRPWLVELGDDRFAVVIPSIATGRTLVAPLSVEAGHFRLADPVSTLTLELYAVDSAAADVDGDGRKELVVEGPDVASSGASCPVAAVRALDASTLGIVAGFDRPGEVFGPGAIGEWDGLPGDDLLVNTLAIGDCPSGSAPVHSALTAIRLADGSTIATAWTYDDGRREIVFGSVLALDVDGDGRDEALVRDRDALAVLDPMHGWVSIGVGGGDPTPLFAGRATTEAPEGLLAWYEATGGSGGDGRLVTATVRRVTAGLDVTYTGDLDLDRGQARTGLMESMLKEAADQQHDPPVWRGDIDGDECPELLAPLLMATCDGTASIREGALWLATRPIATYAVSGAQELLVAAGLDWHPDAGMPGDPTPSAGSPGAWRHGPSGPFVLSELRAADVIYFTDYPVPRPTIDRIAMREQAIDAPGFTGVRVLVRSVAKRIRDRPPLVAPSTVEFLTGGVIPGQLNTMSRIAVPAGQESGRDGSFVRVALPDILTGEPDEVEGWVLTVTQLNDWGEIATPVIGDVTLDKTGPSLSVEVPPTSAVWPWSTQLRGRSEAGVTVHIGDGEPVEADRLGRFVVSTQLAPWPQDVDVTAVDAAGNATTTRVSVVGGLDFRLLPWPAIVATILLIGAVIGALRTGSGPRKPRIREVIPIFEDESQAEIEDLPSGQRG
jgi:hypothetical protein